MLAANSTYSGGTNIGVNGAGTRVGTVRASATQSLGTGTVFIGIGGNDATAKLELDNNISLDNPLLLAARNNTTVAIQNLSGNNTLSGTLAITAGGTNNIIQSDAGTLSFTNANALTNETAAARVVTFQGDGDITVSGAINNGSLGGSLGIVKSGTGTLTFTGLNTYSGNTTVSDGILVVSQDDVLDDNATLSLTSASSLSLTHPGTDRVGSLVINDVVQPDGLYDFGTGKIQVGEGITPFQSWASSKGLDGTPGKENGSSDDPDNDGVSNLEEFAFNGDPLSGTNNGIVRVFTADTSNPGTDLELVLTVAVRAGTPVFTGSPSATATIDGVTYTVGGSLDLTAFDSAVSNITPITEGLPDLSGSGYEYRSFSLNGSAGLPGKGFIRASAQAQ
jgi:autotransporter-associated beta strand protein